MTIERSRPVRMPRGADTPDLEGEMLGVIRAAGLPEPETQYRWARCCPHPKKDHWPAGTRDAPLAWCDVCLNDVASSSGIHDYYNRRFAADFAWPDRKLLLEVQGGSWAGGRHTRGDGYEKDCEKLCEATTRGWRSLWVTGAMIKDGRALEALERALA